MTTKKQKKDTNGPTCDKKVRDEGKEAERWNEGMRGERGCGRRIKTG